MSLEPLTVENKKNGKKWKKQLDSKYDQYVNAAKAYSEIAKRKRMDSVPETEAPPIQLSNPIVIPTSEIPQPILLMQNHQPSVAQPTSSFVNVQRCSVNQATPLLSRVRPDAWIGGPSSQSYVYPLPGPGSELVLISKQALASIIAWKIQSETSLLA